MDNAERGYIELRKPETCLDCDFRNSCYNAETDDDSEQCTAWWFGGHGGTFRELTYKDGRYAVPEWCVLTSANGDGSKVRLTVKLPGHCLECSLYVATEEDDCAEDCYCGAVYLLDSNRMVAEKIFDIAPEVRTLTEDEFWAKERPAWCPLKVDN